MASKFVLDAHALIWYLEGNPRLSTAAKTIVDDPASNLILPVIALAEAAHVISKGLPEIGGLTYSQKTSPAPVFASGFYRTR